MEQLGKANAIRLQSHKGAYVVAHDDKETVGESDDGSSPNAKWLVERVEGQPNVIQLKSCFGLYLTASDGKVDWEPIPDGDGVKFKSCGAKLLQTNGEPISQNWTVNLMRWVFWHVEDWVFWHVVDFIIDLADASNPLGSALEDSSASEPSVQVISVANNSLPPPPAPLPVSHFNPTARRLLQDSYDFGQLGSPVAPDAQEPQPDQVSNPSGQSNSPPPSPPSST